MRYSLEGAREVASKQRIVALDPAGAADHYMVGAGKTANGDDFPCKRAEAALHPVAGDGVADLLADGEAYPHSRVAATAAADQKYERRGRGAPSGVRREKIRAFLDDC